MLVTPDADLLFSLSRCQQLSVLINLLLKGSSEETVTRLNDECLAEWRKAASEWAKTWERCSVPYLEDSKD